MRKNTESISSFSHITDLVKRKKNKAEFCRSKVKSSNGMTEGYSQVGLVKAAIFKWWVAEKQQESTHKLKLV